MLNQDKTRTSAAVETATTPVDSNLKEYLRWQNYNIITQFLHTVRYRHLLKFLNSVDSSSSLNLLEIGCGYGKSIDVLHTDKKLHINEYLGVDIEPQFTDFCKQKFSKEKYQFLNEDIRNYANKNKELTFQPNAIVALECLEHIAEYDIPPVIDWLSSLHCPLFISVPNELGLALLFKNVGSWLIGYVRHKEYSWLETFHATFGRLERVTPHSTGHIGFDYRWLAATIHQRFIITEVGTSPWNFVPRFLSPSIYFYCKPRL